MHAKALLALSLIALPLALVLRGGSDTDDAARARTAVEQLRSGDAPSLVESDIDHNWRYLRPFGCAALVGLAAAICLRESRSAPVQGE